MIDSCSPWVQMWPSREKVFLGRPDPDKIHIEDIAHHLSLINRYTGGTPSPYSVAQHCCIVANELPDDLKLWGLLHDASEAYLGDVSSPLKKLLHLWGDRWYHTLEDGWMRVIADKYGLEWPMPPEVKEMDSRVAATEAESFLKPLAEGWEHTVENGYEPLPYLIDPLSCFDIVKDNFLRKFRMYGGKED